MAANDRSSNPRPDLLGPATLALLLALLAGLLAYGLAQTPGARPDLVYPWRAAQLLLEGRNPYEVLRARVYPFPSPLLYPLPTVLICLPLAPLPLPVANGVMFACSVGALSLALARGGRDPITPFLSAPFLTAAALGQWSPLVMVAGLEARWGWLAVLKPNIGLPLLAAGLRRWAIIGAGVAILVSLLVLPSWPADWIRGIIAWKDQPPPHPVPLTSTAGPLLLLALLRWRRAEARLLLLMSVVPQTLFFADQFPLWLVPRTRRETALLSGLSLLALGIAFARYRRGEVSQLIYACQPLIVPLVYIPCLVMVLTRPNTATALDVAPTLPKG